jgi:hypothetical protein
MDELRDQDDTERVAEALRQMHDGDGQ